MSWGFCLEEYFEGILSGGDFVRGVSVCIPIHKLCLSSIDQDSLIRVTLVT